MEETQNEPSLTRRICPRLPTLTRYAEGICLIILVSVIWVAASQLIQQIFGEQGGFDKPYFLTYFNTAGFMLWNFGWVCSHRWRQTPLRTPISEDDCQLNETTQLGPPCLSAGTGDEQSVQSKYPVTLIFRCALSFCPLWFLANVLFNVSLSLTSVASNTVLSATSTIWALVLSRIILKESINIGKIAALALCIGGTVLVANADDRKSTSSGDRNKTLGDIVALVSAFFYAAYTTVLRWFLPDEKMYSMGMVFGFVGIINTLLTWPGFVVLHYTGWEPFTLPGSKVLLLLFVNALIGTNLSDVLWAKSVILTSPVIATLGLCLTTPIAMLSDLFFRHRTFSALYVLGAASVTAGFILANLPSNREHSALEQHRDEQQGVASGIPEHPNLADT